MDIYDRVENGGKGEVNNKAEDMDSRQIMKGFCEKQREFTLLPKGNWDSFDAEE